jgi:hypothetical protein
MAYLKCLLVGIATGVGTAVAWVILRILTAFQGLAATGSGGFASVSGGVVDVYMPLIVGFALGFYLVWRRQQARLGVRKAQ